MAARVHATAPVVGAGTLSRLRDLGTGHSPVLSVYLDPESAGPGMPIEADGAIRALLGNGRSAAGTASAARMRELLRAPSRFAHGTRSLAMFSSIDGAACELVGLPSEVEPMAVLDTIPWLEPLAGTFAPGDWGVAVLGRHHTRLFRGGPRMLAEFATLRLGAQRRSVPGACSAPRVGALTEEDIGARARRLGQLLMRAQRRRAFEHVVVVAPRERWPVIEAALHRELHDRLAGLLASDLEHAPAQEIARAVSAVVSSAEQEARRCPRCTSTGQSGRGRRTDARRTIVRHACVP